MPKQWKTIASSMLKDSGYPVYGANGIIGYYSEYNHDKETILVTCRGATCGSVNICEPFSYINGNAMALDNLDEKIDIKYLYYYLKKRGFDDVISGSAQPQITRTSIEKIEIPICEISKQKMIVNLFDKIELLINNQKRQLQLLDELVKARFVEMFGDENNSKGWEIVNIEDVANVQVGVVIKPSQYYTDQYNGIKAFRSLNIGNGYIKDDDWVYFSKEGNKKNKKSILSTNDVLAVRSGAPGTACVVTSEYAGSNAIDVIIAHPDFQKVDSHYLCTYTNMPHGKSQIIEGTGGAAQQHFNVGKYNKLKLMLPPLEYQKQYVKFLEEIDKSRLLSNHSLFLIKSLIF